MMTSEEREHLRLLRKYEKESQASYDKAVLLCSGVGALVVACVYLCAQLGDSQIAHPSLLNAAFSFFIASLTTVILGHGFSSTAMFHEIDDFIQGKRRRMAADIINRTMNALSGPLFIFGAFVLSLFFRKGLGT